MTRLTMTKRVGADGVLQLKIPVGIDAANQEVRIIVEPAPLKPITSPADWAAWVDSMAGAWQGDFERPPQGELQERDPL